MDDLISRQAALTALNGCTEIYLNNLPPTIYKGDAIIAVKALPSAQPGQRNARVFQGIIVEYPSISAYPEYEGKPYFSIKYTENGQGFIGYGTYKPEVLSEYLKEYFMPYTQPGWIPCSERLPKPNEYENDVRVYYLVQNEYGDMMVCSWHGGFWLQMYRNTHVEDQVVAWMPLPALYRREGGQDG